MRSLIAVLLCMFAFTACSSTPEEKQFKKTERLVVSDLADVKDLTGKHFDDALEMGQQEVILIVVNLAEQRRDSSISLDVVDDSGKRWSALDQHVMKNHVSIRDFTDASSIKVSDTGVLAAIRIPKGSAKIMAVEERSTQSEILGFAAHSASKISKQRSAVLILLYDDRVEIKAYEE